MIVSIHIPKTAGTTVAYILDYGYSRQIMYDYKEDYRQLESLPLIINHKEFIETFFQVVHGHFFYSKYAEVFPDGRFIVTLRHPVRRVISQYNHILNTHPSELKWPASEIHKGQMDVVEFAGIRNIGNAQAVFTEGREIELFDHVFITESLEMSIQLFQKKFNFFRQDPFAGKGVPVINEHSLREKYYDPTESERVEIFKRCKEDVDIYRRSVEKQKQEARKYLQI